MVDHPDFAHAVMQTLRRALPDRRVLGVWLYGSHARGQATPRSDVDLAVLADRRLDPLAVGVACTELERVAGSRVDLVDLRAASG
ncbi:MAG: nucleotidyltransferase domain-containing protein, partial [Proteobacteria bacterium]|nr:nucleotidyltransferase domain-containing protein [Pseudomonadota bacterium]